MKKTLIVLGILVALLGITACTRTEKNVATGAAVGAVAGRYWWQWYKYCNWSWFRSWSWGYNV